MMDIKITTKQENDLLGRTEYEGVVSFTGATPAYPQFKQEFAAQLKVKEDVVAIKNIWTTFGMQSAKFVVYVYDTPENLVKTEPKVKAKKEKKVEEKK